MKNSYDPQLKIWVVGLRAKNPSGTIWDELWKPTSVQWFVTRRQCWKYIREEIHKSLFEHYEYKPLRYGPEEPR